MPGPRDDTQYPKRITLPTLDNKMGSYMGGSSKVPFMNAKNTGIEATPNASKVNWNPFTQRGPFGSGGAAPANSMPVTYNSSLFATPNTPNAAINARNTYMGGGGGAPNGLMSPKNPFMQSLGGVIGAGVRMQNGGLPFNTGAGSGAGGTGGLSEIEAYARDRINKALGLGWYENFVKTRGMSPVDFYRLPNNRYWDESDSPDGAINSAIRDEINNARNAAQWAQEHGNTPIGDEQWQRWYFANRQGMRHDDVMNDGSEVVY